MKIQNIFSQEEIESPKRFVSEYRFYLKDISVPITITVYKPVLGTGELKVSGTFFVPFRGYFLVFFVFFLPKILSASSIVCGGHLPSVCNFFRWPNSLKPTMVRHFGNLLQPKKGPLLLCLITSSPSLHL